jgi:hypothetical protein
VKKHPQVELFKFICVTLKSQSFAVHRPGNSHVSAMIALCMTIFMDCTRANVFVRTVIR